jgi:hypothetical protein
MFRPVAGAKVSQTVNFPRFFQARVSKKFTLRYSVTVLIYWINPYTGCIDSFCSQVPS